MISPSSEPRVRTVRAAWRLIYPFWVSEHKWKAYGLLAFLLAETFLTTYLSVQLNSWSGRFTDALIRYDQAAIWSMLIRFVLVVAGFIAMGVLNMLARSTLTILWREWLTHRFLDRWLAREAFYRIEREQVVDNPDQRITEDISSLVSTTYSLTLGLIGTLASLASFSVILWNLSGPLTFKLLGRAWTIPGYMLWIAISYAIVTAITTHLTGRRLMALEFGKQRAEADFRFMMAGVREHAEQVALYQGSRTESHRMKMGFTAVRHNFWQIVRFNLRFDGLNILLRYVSMVFGMVAALPRYLAHAVTMGGMNQLTSAFGSVNGSLSWFVFNYTSLQGFRVVVARLSGLEQAANSPSHAAGGIAHTTTPYRQLAVTNLALCTPAERPLTEALTFSVAPGERWLVRGDSGVGKSTMMRALAGIWPYGSGSVAVPEGATLLFLSQKNYVPPGTLKAALCYPSEETAFGDAECRQALADCRLAGYSDCLDEVARWGQRLSPGEQQRLAIARALLQRPDYLFLDESTSALDVATERHLYDTLVRQLPNTAMVSISHRTTLDAVHSHTLDVTSAGKLAAEPGLVLLTSHG